MGGKQSAPARDASQTDDTDGRAREERASDAFAETAMVVGAHRVRLLSLPDVPESDSYQTGHDLTGLVRWPVSSLVAGLLLRRGALANDTDVLDVGCGTGVAGIAAAVVCSPRRVVLADRQPRCRELAAKNARLQDGVGCAIDVEAYGWGTGDPRPPERGAFGLVIACECLYTAFDEMRSFEKYGARFHDGQALARFVDFLDWCVAPRGVALIAFDVRNALDQERTLGALAAGGFGETEVLAAPECVAEAIAAKAGAQSAVVVCARRGPS